MRQGRAFAHTRLPTLRFRSFERDAVAPHDPKKAHFLGVKRILLHTSGVPWS
jgi:hypothetical protein